jgi:hypothetical protein
MRLGILTVLDVEVHLKSSISGIVSSEHGIPVRCQSDL